jgi:hypothetical protein
LRGGHDEQTLLAVAGYDHLAVVTAFEHAFEGVKFQAVLGFVVSMARQAGSLEERLDVFIKGQLLFIGGRGQLADIDSADVPLVVLRQDRQGGDGHAK